MAPVNGNVAGGTLRRSLDWLMGVTTVHPSLHRLKNALGLTVGLAGGRYAMDRLVGETPSGQKINKEDVFALFQPLHGTLAYNHYSDDPKDRWMKVVDLWVPAGLGAAGAVLGSHDYGLHDQPLLAAAKAALKDVKGLTIDKAESAAIALQGKPWKIASGVTSVFGSSSGLQVFNPYGSTLSVAFFSTLPRNKVYTPYFPALQKFASGNSHPYAFGPTSMLSRLQARLIQNPSPIPSDVENMAKAILEPWFGARVTDQHVSDFLGPMLKARGKVFEPGGVPASARAELEKTLSGYLSGVGLEKHLMNIGLNPATAMIGRNGLMETGAHALGAGAALEHLESAFRRGVQQRHGLGKLPSLAVNEATRAADRAVQRLGLTAMGGMWLGLGGLAYWGLTREGEQKAEQHSAEHKESGSKALHFMERVSDMLNAPESLSMHRTSCALGLTIGGYIGTQIANIVAGRTLSGAPLAEEKVPGFLKHLYKTVTYNPHSSTPKDRWGYILHFAIPAALGVAGVVAASDLFFRTRKRQVNKQADYLDDYENRATMAEAGAYTLPTAVLAVPVAPSGGWLWPGVNYAMALGTRFTLGSGRKVAMPGLGKVWTGSTSRYNIGPVALRDHMIKYAINNPSEHPEQLHEMSRGIVRQWFPEATDQQVQEFVDLIEKDRAEFFRAGEGVPREMKEQCEELLEKHFKGAGLEKTLKSIGLDPMQAVLGNNGLSGNLARWLGAGNELDEITEEYHTKYAKRAAATPAAPAPATEPAIPDAAVIASHVGHSAGAHRHHPPGEASLHMGA